MKRVLVTGASGLLGRALLPRLLDAGYEVHAVTTDAARLAFAPGAQARTADLRDGAACRAVVERVRPEALVHLAWDQKDAGFRNAPANLDWLSVSVNLLRAFYDCGGKRFLFAGTSSEYDGRSGRMEETAAARPVSMYGQCKRAFSETLQAFAERYGVSAVTPRYFTIYGEHDGHAFGATPAATADFLAGRPVACRAPNTLRDYIYAGDAAAATLLLLESELCGAVNVASGVPRSMRAVFTALARAADALPLLSFENEDQPGDILVADTGRLNRELGFTCRMNFEEGLRRTVAWRRKQGGHS